MAHSKKDYRQIMAIQKKQKEQLLKLNPKLTNNSGIYVFFRTDADGITSFYCGQSVHCIDRIIAHMNGFQQHIDLSIRKRGLRSAKNPYGWYVKMAEYPREKLDEMERYWILQLQKKGYQCRYNKTGGGQDEGKEKINEYKPTKGYRDGLVQGRKKASKEISHLFDLHLNVSKKSDRPNKNQDKALEKFQAFLDYHKLKEGSEENET